MASKKTENEKAEEILKTVWDSYNKNLDDFIFKEFLLRKVKYKNSC